MHNYSCFCKFSSWIMDREIKPDMPRCNVRIATASSSAFSPIYPSLYVISIVPSSVSTKAVIKEYGPNLSSFFCTYKLRCTFLTMWLCSKNLSEDIKMTVLSWIRLMRCESTTSIIFTKLNALIFLNNLFFQKMMIELLALLQNMIEMLKR